MTTTHDFPWADAARRRGGKRAFAALSMGLLLANCVSLGAGDPPDEMLSLTPALTAPAGRAASGTIADSIVVQEPEAERSVDVLRVPVRIDDSSIAYLKDLTWVEKPARQFRGLLAEALRAKTDRLVVEAGAYEVMGRTRLAGRLVDMGYDARSQSVVVRYDAVRSERDGTVITKRFEAVVPGVAPKADAVAPALNQAANDVVGQIVDWMSV